RGEHLERQPRAHPAGEQRGGEQRAHPEQEPEPGPEHSPAEHEEDEHRLHPAGARRDRADECPHGGEETKEGDGPNVHTAVRNRHERDDERQGEHDAENEWGGCRMAGRGGEHGGAGVDEQRPGEGEQADGGDGEEREREARPHGNRRGGQPGVGSAPLALAGARAGHRLPPSSCAAWATVRMGAGANTRATWGAVNAESVRIAAAGPSASSSPPASCATRSARRARNSTSWEATTTARLPAANSRKSPARRSSAG